MTNRVELEESVLEEVNGGYLAFNQNADGTGTIWIYHIDANGNKYQEGPTLKFNDGKVVSHYLEENRATMGDKTILKNLMAMGVVTL